MPWVRKGIDPRLPDPVSKPAYIEHCGSESRWKVFAAILLEHTLDICPCPSKTPGFQKAAQSETLGLYRVGSSPTTLYKDQALVLLQETGRPMKELLCIFKALRLRERVEQIPKSRDPEPEAVLGSFSQHCLLATKNTP